jgi:hypothetical protein
VVARYYGTVGVVFRADVESAPKHSAVALHHRCHHPGKTGVHSGYIDRSDRAGRLTQNVPAKFSPTGTHRNDASMRRCLVDFFQEFTSVPLLTGSSTTSNFYWLESMSLFLNTALEESQRWSLTLCGSVTMFFPASWLYSLRAVLKRSWNCKDDSFGMGLEACGQIGKRLGTQVLQRDSEVCGEVTPHTPIIYSNYGFDTAN